MFSEFDCMGMAEAEFGVADLLGAVGVIHTESWRG